MKTNVLINKCINSINAHYSIFSNVQKKTFGKVYFLLYVLISGISLLVKNMKISKPTPWVLDKLFITKTGILE